MRRILVPISVYAALSLSYFLVSGAPLRVHGMSIAALALGLLVPSLWSAFLSTLRLRVVVSATFALASLVAWDWVAHQVVAKAEPFDIFWSTPWVYLVGPPLLASFSVAVAWLASPPNYLIKPTAGEPSRFNRPLSAGGGLARR
jgi:hypothetical protein